MSEPFEAESNRMADEVKSLRAQLTEQKAKTAEATLWGGRLREALTDLRNTCDQPSGRIALQVSDALSVPIPTLEAHDALVRAKVWEEALGWFLSFAIQQGWQPTRLDCQMLEAKAREAGDGIAFCAGTVTPELNTK